MHIYQCYFRSILCIHSSSSFAVKNMTAQCDSPSSFGQYREQPLYPLPLYPSVNPAIVPTYPNIDLDNDKSFPPKPIANEIPPLTITPLPLFTPEQILSMDELTIDCMSYLDINRLYESVLMIHHRGLVDIQKYTDYAKLKQIEQLIVNALYKDTENWRIMLSSYDKCHRINQARLAFLKEQYDKHKY